MVADRREGDGRRRRQGPVSGRASPKIAVQRYNTLMNDTTGGELLTVHDVALRCRLHEVTVRRHISQGKLPAVRVGGSVRVRREDLERYIEPLGAPPQRGTRQSRPGRPLTPEDPFWKLAGMIDDPSGDWVSSDVHRAVADAYDSPG